MATQHGILPRLAQSSAAPWIRSREKVHSAQPIPRAISQGLISTLGDSQLILFQVRSSEVQINDAKYDNLFGILSVSSSQLNSPKGKWPLHVLRYEYYPMLVQGLIWGGALKLSMAAGNLYQYANCSRLVMLGLLGVGCLLLLHALTFPYVHDEELFIAASLHTVDLPLYREVLYLQTPYFAHLLAALFQFFDGHYFLIGRLVIWFFSYGSVLLVYWLSQSLSADYRSALAFALFFATASLMIRAFGLARNDAMPCFFTLLSLNLLHLASKRRTWAGWLYFLAGVSIGTAVGTKISYAFVPLVVLLHETWRQLKQRQDVGSWRPILALIAGGALSSLPIIFHMATSWDAFYYGNFEYHLTSPIQWYTNNGLKQYLSLQYQVKTAIHFLNKDTVLATVLFSLIIFLVALNERIFSRFWVYFVDHDGFLYLGLVIFALFFAFLPRPPHPQYFQPIVPVLIIFTAAIYSTAGQMSSIRKIRGPILLATIILAAIPRLGSLTKDIYIGFRDGFTVARIHGAATEIRNVLEKRGVRGKVATFSPIRIIDSGLPIYTELVSGPFFFRTAKFLSAEKVHALKGASANTLVDMLTRDPPAAIFTGFESAWEKSPDAELERFAHENGYVTVSGNFDGGNLFVRPKAVQ